MSNAPASLSLTRVITSKSEIKNMEASLSTYLFTQGVLGVACLVLGYVAFKLYNKTERLEKEKTDLMEARRIDTVQVFEKVTQVLETNSQTNRLLTEKIETSKQTSVREAL